MDIDYSKDNYRFNARASAVIYSKDKSKILLFKIGGRDYFLLPGGRINMYEDSKNAIRREIKEETGFEIDFQFLSVLENFIERNGIKILQYNFLYKGIYDGKTTDFKCKDRDNQFFKWINVKDIGNYKIYPESIDLIINMNINHLIEKH